jgi:hypothetical protein
MMKLDGECVEERRIIETTDVLMNGLACGLDQIDGDGTLPESIGTIAPG